MFPRLSRVLNHSVPSPTTLGISTVRTADALIERIVAQDALVLNLRRTWRRRKRSQLYGDAAETYEIGVRRQDGSSSKYEAILAIFIFLNFTR